MIRVTWKFMLVLFVVGIVHQEYLQHDPNKDIYLKEASQMIECLEIDETREISRRSGMGKVGRFSIRVVYEQSVSFETVILELKRNFKNNGWELIAEGNTHLDRYGMSYRKGIWEATVEGYRNRYTLGLYRRKFR